MKLNFNKKKNIGTIDFEDEVKVYDYGSKFFAISEENELLAKELIITGKEPFMVQDITTEERYEYLEDVKYTNSDNYTVSAVLDRSNCFIKGNKIDILGNTINEKKYIYCSSVDYVDFEENSDEYDLALKAVQTIFDDDSIDDLSILDEDKNSYYSFTIFNNAIAVFASDDMGERILINSLNFENDENNDKNLAYCTLLAEERLSFDPCSLISLDEIENRKRFEYIKYINDLKLKNMNETNMAKVLEMNYKALNKSPKKEMYFNLYKQKLINTLLDQS